MTVAGALDGLRILEVGRFVGAAYATKLLADLGADVVKIKPPQGGDPIRQRGPFPGGVPHPERSGLFLYLNANKRGIALDLRQPRGREVFDRLVADADLRCTTCTRPTWPRRVSTGRACAPSTPGWS